MAGTRHSPSRAPASPPEPNPSPLSPRSLFSSRAVAHLASAGGDPDAGADAGLSAAVLGADGQCSAAAGGLGAFCLTLAAFAIVARSTLETFAKLCHVLSPESPPIRVSHVSRWRIALAYMLYAPLVPAATLTTLLSSSIVWSGVRFDVVRGRVDSMHRRDASGEWYTVPRETSLERTLRAQAEAQIASSELLSGR